MSTSAVTALSHDELVALSPAALIDYLEATHHKYIRETAPLLIEYTQKMVRAHGEDCAEVKPLAALVQALVDDLTPHLYKEEQILFPAIKALSQGEHVNGCFGHIGNPINAMEHEHREADDLLQQIRTLTADYKVPDQACYTWRTCYQTLAEFDADLQAHIQLENQVLFPKALAY
jgi:regulator of cell morphogenesis and NO signaling